MDKLSENFRVKTAKDLTELAIQNNLINKHGSEEETAKSICIFFQTIVEKLDCEVELNVNA